MLSLFNTHSENYNPIYVIGTTAPKRDTQTVQRIERAERFLNIFEAVDPDGYNIYDIQDESSRNLLPRPFKFSESMESCEYAAMLKRISNRDTICYKSIQSQSQQAFTEYLKIAQESYQQNNLVIVGSPCVQEQHLLSVKQAIQSIQKIPGMTAGGISIAERHLNKGREHERMFEKINAGCEFFVTQTIYDAQATVQLLKDFKAKTQNTHSANIPVILSFSPCGNNKTLEFMHWLGISVPTDLQQRLQASTHMLDESVQICLENLDYILTANSKIGVNLGLNIESLTHSSTETNAACELFKKLKKLMRAAYMDKTNAFAA